jgi:hypothetical protein
MAKGQEGLLVDFDTGVVRQNHVLVQSGPGVVVFLGLGSRTRRLIRFACNEAPDPDPDPFIAHCRRIALAVECGWLAKAQDEGVPRAVLDIEDRTLRRLVIAEALAKAGYNPGEPRDTETGAGPAKATECRSPECGSPKPTKISIRRTSPTLWRRRGRRCGIPASRPCAGSIPTTRI